MAGGSTVGNARRAGKYNKPTRGGGKHFSRNLQPVDADGNQISMWSANSDDKSGTDEEESSDEGSSDEEASDDGGPSKASAADAAADNNRDERKALKKARKEAAIAKQHGRTVEVGDLPSSDEESDEDDMPANPNHSKAARSMTKASKNGVEAITDGVEGMKMPASRREREALEAVAAKERYMRLQAQGKTDEAKADLARLSLIREQRAAEAARRQAEKEEKEEQEKARKADIEARDAKKRELAAGPKKGSKKK
ncbi:Casein kinase substrate, phosphoprotein PP28 [Drechmeria coniospora]|uniref:Casein kinase substrate, phosphoprotein PP28 n=1 Tax=Drechmeria coniospora TaxID=98403 RepID=A0A151GUH9_DRECN|nr:Casein kinase substrate, phosphoprotein PP28 [Drechmeria coniospora]KYK60713.1 Casein kinase substrate, phosphoprotein PP28 [Drechmeria coniospora]ODA83399.1 hypothetical protein RJ55_01913 [Drechmeria coniospora]